MSLRGPSRDLRLMLRNLDERSFVDLAADILARRGHSNIKVMDGPGDGCRDIHSLDLDGARHLTQCKFTKSKSAIASRSVGELPLGMLRLGYLRGLFVTNGRISPPAKRELASDYTNASFESLEYLEDTELLTEVFDDVVLRSIWYDGHAIQRVSYVLVVPFLVRAHADDRPHLLRANRVSVEANGMLIEVRIRESTREASEFAPYRPPHTRTLQEGWTTSIRAGEAIISGPLAISSLPQVLRTLEEHLTKLVAPLRAEDGTIAIRIGRPVLAPMGGEEAGTRIPMDMAAYTIIASADSHCTEPEWLLPSESSEWLLPAGLSAFYGAYLAWYTPRNDLCLRLQITSIPTDEDRYTIANRVAHTRRWWKESFFTFFPRGNIDLPEAKTLPKPWRLFDWDEDTFFLVWLHPQLEATFHRVQAEPDDEVSVEEFNLEIAAQNRWLTELKRTVLELGAEDIDPDMARHMVAICYKDPFPPEDEMLYRTLELLEAPDSIPSPIDPFSRRYSFTVAWLIPERAHNFAEGEYSEALATVDSVLAGHGENAQTSFQFDVAPQDGLFVLFEVEPSHGMNTSRADLLLAELELRVQKVINGVEEVLRAQHPSLKRATLLYWTNRIHLSFLPSLPST